MSDADRKKAAELIEKVMAQKNGDGKMPHQLNLTRLAELIIKEADCEAKREANSLLNPVGIYHRLAGGKDHYLNSLEDAKRDSLNLAAREVMGLIPYAKWDHTGENPITRMFEDGPFGVGLACKAPHPINALDVNKSLRSQGVVCTVFVPPEPPHTPAPAKSSETMPRRH